MPTIEKLSLALPTEMANLVRQAVEAGEYSSQTKLCGTPSANRRTSGRVGRRRLAACASCGLRQSPTIPMAKLLSKSSTPWKRSTMRWQRLQVSSAPATFAVHLRQLERDFSYIGRHSLRRASLVVRSLRAVREKWLNNPCFINLDLRSVKMYAWPQLGSMSFFFAFAKVTSGLSAFSAATAHCFR